MTTNKIPTDEELAKAWFRRMKLLYKIPELENVLNWVEFTDIVDLLGEARAAGREEQRNSEKLNEEMLHTIFPNSIKSSDTFGYGIIESQEEFIAEFRKYILNAKERGAKEQREKDAELCELLPSDNIGRIVGFQLAAAIRTQEGKGEE